MPAHYDKKTHLCYKNFNDLDSITVNLKPVEDREENQMQLNYDLKMESYLSVDWIQTTVWLL